MQKDLTEHRKNRGPNPHRRRRDVSRSSGHPSAPPIIHSDLIRIERDLAELPATDAMNALPCLLWDWLNDGKWVAASLEIPCAERRTWLASVGKWAFDGDCGGYASFLRENVRGLDYIWSSTELNEILRRHTQLLFVNLSDVLDIRYARHDGLWDDVVITGAEHFNAALRQERGVIALSVHQSHPGFGFLHPKWRELGLSAVANLGDRSMTHSSLLLEGLRDRVEMLPTTASALRPMLSRLASGGCVAIYADFLYAGTPGVLSSLFGGPIHIASAAVSLALRTRAAVIPVSVARCWPPDRGDVQVHFGAQLPLDDLSSKDPTARDTAAIRFGVAIECLIRRQPSAWRLWATLQYRWQCAEESLAETLAISRSS